ncbi:uncharacterized protein LOC125857510 [Solanum stenotomum]|uniref:uncharacterized protein LOC125857510 n=1 Tax=Solanum stenotomum TaxID=172797 RepID=UPI0020D1E00E|nr:uncharacterized protein LOC125857510 [Solanum stenotomum]
MGATGTGKFRLSVDLATNFRGEIINSDKMQVFKGLEIVTNNITHAEKQGVRHYLLVILFHKVLGEIELDSNFTAEDFCLKSIVYTENFLKTQCVAIIVGGSNSYIEKLVEHPVFMFKYKDLVPGRVLSSRYKWSTTGPGPMQSSFVQIYNGVQLESCPRQKLVKLSKVHVLQRMQTLSQWDVPRNLVSVFKSPSHLELGDLVGNILLLSQNLNRLEGGGLMGGVVPA